MGAGLRAALAGFSLLAARCSLLAARCLRLEALRLLAAPAPDGTNGTPCWYLNIVLAIVLAMALYPGNSVYCLFALNK